MTTPYPPPPGPPDYGPGGYHPYGPGPYSPYGPYGPTAPRATNPIGTAIALVGGALALLGFFLEWYTDVQLGDIVNALDADGAKAFPKAYFGWLMFVLLAATVVAALFANAPSGAAAALRIISPILGVLGAVLVVVSLNSLRTGGSVFDNSAIGLYLTLAGFVISGGGGVFGPRRTGP